MKIQDDRTVEEKKTHSILVVGTDSFLSNWGHAANGMSYAAWACTSEDVYKVFRWVSTRREMKRVRIVTDGDGNGKYRPKGKGHLHIYVVNYPEHPSLA